MKTKTLVYYATIANWQHAEFFFRVLPPALWALLTVNLAFARFDEYAASATVVEDQVISPDGEPQD